MQNEHLRNIAIIAHVDLVGRNSARSVPAA